MHIDRIKIKEAFKAYTDRYNASDPKIRLKIDHTYRVAQLCERIALEEGYDAAIQEMAWLTGMLHDIGRFEQVRRFDTFLDSLSVDHANFGADLLFNNGLIKNFIDDGDLSPNELEILECAIRNHSAFQIAERLSEVERIHCNLLRDADKIDIYRVNCDTPLEEIYNVTTEDLKTSAVTPEVKQAFEEKHAVLRALKKTAIDNVVGHICLYFELVYPTSQAIAREQGYLGKLLDFESENSDTREWFESMREELDLEKW